eukprot:4245107-Prymnesium_polylepis.1
MPGACNERSGGRGSAGQRGRSRRVCRGDGRNGGRATASADDGADHAGGARRGGAGGAGGGFGAEAASEIRVSFGDCQGGRRGVNMRGPYGGVPCGSRWWLALTGGCMAARGGGLGLGGAAAADQLRGADGGYGGPPIDDCVPEEGV